MTQAVTLANSVQSPQVTVYTSGSGTYTTPTGAKYLTVQMCGGGAGAYGSALGATGSSPTAGGNTTFGTSLLTANGGSIATGFNGSGGSGGSATISSPAVGMALSGGGGNGTFYPNALNVYIQGPSGGANPFGGVGYSSVTTPGNSAANTGAGGTGGGNPSVAGMNTGASGGAGGYIQALITNPSATYSYAIGAAGSGGSAGTSGYVGGNGGSGVIYITAYF